MARTMLSDSKISDRFSSQAIRTAIHILNRGLLRENTNKNPYEIWTGRPTNINHFRIFGSKCYTKKDDGNIGKFESRSDEEIFLGYSCKRKA